MTLSRFYIYNSGEKESLWSEGPRQNITNTGLPDGFTLTKEPDYLKIYGTGVNDEYSSFISGPYRLEYYDSVSINWTYGADSNGGGSSAVFGIDPSGNARFDNYDVSVTNILSSASASSIDSIDVSSLSGEYYIYISVETNGKPNNTHAYTHQVYFSGDIPNASSSNTFGDCVCMGVVEIDDITGSGNMTLDSCGVTSFGGDLANNYGYLGETDNSYSLDSMSAESTGRTSINGSGNSTLGSTTLTSFAGSSGNHGATSYSLSNINIFASGGDYSTQYGALNSNLGDIGVTSSGSSDGISRYSVEWKRFIGRACITLDKEYSASTTNPSGDCFSMLKPVPLSLKNGYGPLLYDECDCSINIPVYLNRAANEDVELSITTSQPTTSINFSGDVVPALSGVDYVHHTGLYIISSGSDYCNFPVTIIDNSSTISNYFNVNVLYAKSRNICQGGTYTINIVLGSG